MSDDFEKDEVIELAEKIFALRVDIEQADRFIEAQAKKSIKAAMLFRKVEKEIFEENEDEKS